MITVTKCWLIRIYTVYYSQGDRNVLLQEHASHLPLFVVCFNGKSLHDCLIVGTDEIPLISGLTPTDQCQGYKALEVLDIPTLDHTVILLLVSSRFQFCVG